MDAPDGLRPLLTSLSRRMTPWADAEARLGEILPAATAYLGGDGLRPYAAWTGNHGVRLAGIVPAGLPFPPLLADVLGGTYGVATVRREGPFVEARLPGGPRLAARLRVPRLLLVGLGDTERYRGARLPLGVARLAQWLRFTHAARVVACDYNLLSAPLDTVGAHLDGSRFDLVGVSVNFGQWGMLEELATLVNVHRPPLVVLGNILAAFSPERAAGLFRATEAGRLFVATGLGERPLEQLCRQHRDPGAWPGIAGLARPRRGIAPAGRALPPDLVFPDDAMLLDVAGRGGQLALETSFGCQYGACTFCPRDHRGDGWSRGHRATVLATLERLAPSGAPLSLVDEEFFGAEGLADPPAAEPAAAAILTACRRLGIRYEIYTRVEQLFDRRRSPVWNTSRARLLATEAGAMSRVFVGVESGSPGQLRRYGKGQTVAETVDALRVGSALGVPLEFGFITFDPLLTRRELAENITFLGRRDIIVPAVPGSVQDRVGFVEAYLGGIRPRISGRPLYQHVAYMATELEILAHSRYESRLRRRDPELLDGTYDPGFARYGVTYRDPLVSETAGWCRVWTEGMFAPVYEARMAARARGTHAPADAATSLVARYRDATFALLIGLTALLMPGTAVEAQTPPGCPALSGDDPVRWLGALARATLPDGPEVTFDLALRVRRRGR